MLVKMDVFDVNKRVKKGGGEKKKETKKSRGPKTDFVGRKQTGRGRSEAKNAGVETFSFIWTLMVTKR